MIAPIRDPGWKTIPVARQPTDYLQVVDWLNDMYEVRHKYMEDAASSSLIDRHDDYVLQAIEAEALSRLRQFEDQYVIVPQMTHVPGSPVSHTLLWAIAGPLYTGAAVVAQCKKDSKPVPRAWFAMARTSFNPLTDDDVVPHAQDYITAYYNPVFAADLCHVLNSYRHYQPQTPIFTCKEVADG